MNGLREPVSAKFERYRLPWREPIFPECNKFPILYCGVEEAHSNIQAPKELILFSALSAAAIAVQGLYNVLKPTGQAVPLSLNILMVADSGERKSTVEANFFESIKDFEQLKAAEFKCSNMEWENSDKIWLAKERAFLSEIAKRTRRGLDTSDVELRLIEHAACRSVKPMRTKLLYEDVTSEALFSGLKTNGASAGLVSSEGAAILDGRAFRDYPKLNSIWSGDEIRVDRKSGDSYALKDARLSLAIMVQKRVLEGSLKKGGDPFRGSGFWARFLVCCPKSTQGHREIKNTTMTWHAKSKFSATIQELLEKSDASSSAGSVEEKINVSFGPQAAEEWFDICNCLELGIGQGRFEGMTDHASKLADNISRVAAIVHCFEGGIGDIPVVALRFAFDLCLWASSQYRGVFCLKDEAEVCADELDAWLLTHWEKGVDEVRKNHIRQFGPSSIRKASRLDSALSILNARGVIDFYTHRGTLFVEIRKRVNAGR